MTYVIFFVTFLTCSILVLCAICCDCFYCCRVPYTSVLMQCDLDVLSCTLLIDILCLSLPPSFHPSSSLPPSLPPPSLPPYSYHINRDTLFSYHAASEQFLHRLMALYVSSHYKNSPNDLQLLSDAPAHHVFVLVPPVLPTSTTLPDILCVLQVSRGGGGRRGCCMWSCEWKWCYGCSVTFSFCFAPSLPPTSLPPISSLSLPPSLPSPLSLSLPPFLQVCLEGGISRSSVIKSLSRGKRASGDLIPWTISQQFADSNFASLSGARVVRIAVHPDLQVCILALEL